MNPNQFTSDSISDQTKAYCLDNFGYPDLAEYFMPAFKKNWKDRLEDGRKPKWKDPDLALKRWVREASPRGQIYNIKSWESALAACKEKEFRKPINIKLPIMKTTPQPTDRLAAQKELKKALLMLQT